MQIEYTPEVCRDHKKIIDEVETEVKATFSGHITLRVPTFDERYEAMEAIGVTVSTKGEIDVQNSALKLIREMVRASKKFYISVDLKRLSDGKEFKSLEDLEFDSSCDAILLEVAREVKTGFKPSGN